MEIASFKTWLDALGATPQNEEEVEKKPGIKLIDFCDVLNLDAGALPPMETVRTAKLLQSVRDMQSIDAGLSGVWVEQWQQ